MAQKDRVLKYIDDFGSISVAEAINEIGVGCLTKCISNIRKDGTLIITDTVYHKNRYGQPTHHAVYRRG